jgi:hypothetical protein
MSDWTARLFAEGRSLDSASFQNLARLVSDVPVCLCWVGERWDHPRVDGRIDPEVDPGTIVGAVRETRLMAGALYGLVSIAAPALDLFLLNRERRGRLVETAGLSVRGRGVELDIGDGDSVEWFTQVTAFDLCDWPAAGGCLIQSDAAEAAGRPWPALPAIAPVPRPARESSGGRSMRLSTASLETAFRVIPEGGDY